MNKFMNKFRNAFKIYSGKGKKGITGLETAIILIAFVTVASVLGYSVLSAGIFSSEKGKETVYNGLAQAKASMQVRGSVYALEGETIDGNVETIQFNLSSVLSDETVDFGNVHINYSDDTVALTDVPFDTQLIGDDSVNPESPVLGPNQQMVVTIDLSATPFVVDDTAVTTVKAYDTFTIQVLPSKGAAITIQRTLPGTINTVNDLF